MRKVEIDRVSSINISKLKFTGKQVNWILGFKYHNHIRYFTRLEVCNVTRYCFTSIYAEENLFEDECWDTSISNAIDAGYEIMQFDDFDELIEWVRKNKLKW